MEEKDILSADSNTAQVGSPYPLSNTLNSRFHTSAASPDTNVCNRSPHISADMSLNLLIDSK